MIATTEVKERPILFSGPMVRAILAGEKTQTRRIVNPQPPPGGKVTRCHYSQTGWSLEYADGGCQCKPLKQPYGYPGDRLWVRENFSLSTQTIPLTGTGARWDFGNRPAPKVWYQADNDRPTWAETKWQPSIFLPRWACRIALEITEIRVEPLQQIREADAQREGFEQTEMMLARRRFELLWGSINGKDSWAANPWVWVIEFQRVEARQ